MDPDEGFVLFDGGRPADGSSSSSTVGSIISARPIATIWRSPPESDPARCLRRLPSSGKRLVTKSKRSGEARAAGKAHLQVLLDGQAGEHVVVLRDEAHAPGDQLVGLKPGDVRPRTTTEPECTFTRPNMAFSSVDLPAPLGPMMPISSPLRASMLQPLRMLTPGMYPATRSVTLTTGSPLRRCGAGRAVALFLFPVAAWRAWQVGNDVAGDDAGAPVPTIAPRAHVGDLNQRRQGRRRGGRPGRRQSRRGSS